jgi:hypothetical protein
MYQRGARMVAAATAAGAAIVTLGLTGTAAMAATASSIPIVYTKSTAGYLDSTSGAVDFRFVAASVKMAACQPKHVIPQRANNANATIGLSVTGWSATITLTCGGGAGTVAYRDGRTHGTFKLSPSIGDVLSVSVYRRAAASTDELKATDTTTGATQTVPVATPAAVVYNRAELESVISNSGIAHRPSPTVRLWDFRFCDVTSTAGFHGGITGPWSTQRLWDWPNPANTFGSVMYPTIPPTGRQFSTNLVSGH